MKNKLLITAFLGLASINIQAKEVEQELQVCAKNGDNIQRLACFDSLVETMMQEQQTVSAKPAIDNFGRDDLKKKAEELKNEVTEVTLTIEKLQKTTLKKWKITFVNGQVWQQTDSESIRLASGQKVKLIQGMFGSTFLKRLDLNKRIRVKRIK